MRIFLLPISTRQAIVYCQRLTEKPAAQLSYADRIQKKATDTWASWEAAERGWKKKVVEYGNYGLQRIPYQEWGLKSFPPSNPQLQADQIVAGKKFEVVFPGNVMEQEAVTKVLTRLATERKQLHHRRWIGSMVALPFTIPFALIPVIPNIPFFYCAYRSWSHWRALKGSDHLEFIIDHRLFRPVSTAAVETIYKRAAPKHLHSFQFITPSQIERSDLSKEELLLQPGSHTLVAKELGVPELSTEIERAVWQVQKGLQGSETKQEANTAASISTKSPESPSKDARTPK